MSRASTITIRPRLWQSPGLPTTPNVGGSVVADLQREEAEVQAGVVVIVAAGAHAAHPELDPRAVAAALKTPSSEPGPVERLELGGRRAGQVPRAGHAPPQPHALDRPSSPPAG